MLAGLPIPIYHQWSIIYLLLISMIYYGNNEQKQKTSHLFAMMIGFMIGVTILGYTMAQRETPDTEQTVNRDDYGLSDVPTNETGDKLKQTGNQEHRQTNPEPRKQESWETKWSITEDRDSTAIQGKLIIPKWFPEDSLATKYATYEWEISNWDKRFLLKLKTENWWYNINQQSNVWTNWKREDSWGLCQLHRKRHSKIVDDPRFFTDYKWHIEQCYNKYKWGTKFYWQSEWLSFDKFFTIKTI